MRSGQQSCKRLPLDSHHQVKSETINDRAHPTCSLLRLRRPDHIWATRDALLGYAYRLSQPTVLLEMEDASEIYFRLDGIIPNEHGGLLDNAFKDLPRGTASWGSATQGTAAEMGIAINQSDLLDKVRFLQNGRVYTGRQFILAEISAGRVKNPKALEWLRGAVGSVE